MKQSETRAAQSIDAILAEVRSRLPPRKPLPIQPGGRRDELVNVPMIALGDRSETVPVGLPVYRVSDFVALDEEAMLRNAYRVILGREVDPVGRGNYLPALRNGRVSAVGVLGSLRYSREGRARGVRVRGLLPAYLGARLSNVRVLGKLVAPFVQFGQLPTTQRAQQIRMAALDQRQDEMAAAINRSLLAVRKTLVQVDVLTRATEADMVGVRAMARESLDLTNGEQLELRVARGQLSQQADRLAALAEAIRTGLPRTEAAVVAEEVAEEVAAGNLDSLYVAFENRFRGTTDEIGKRSQRYLPMLRETGPVAGGAPVLDIGCGRGEWLSLLRDNNIEGMGIDLNQAMVEEARGRGHKVESGDAIAYLQGLPEGSLGAISAFHVVEHLPFPTLVALFDAARRALRPGGIILFETPNPENLVVGACTFHYDPTHVRPLPPDVLRFLAEARGLEAARIIRRDEDCQLDQPESGFVPAEVNDWFRQPPDYAVYARKPTA